jgi:hypothetical protein
MGPTQFETPVPMQASATRCRDITYPALRAGISNAQSGPGRRSPSHLAEPRLLLSRSGRVRAVVPMTRLRGPAVNDIEWTHPSVLRLLEEAGASDPIVTIEHRARDIALAAMEEGWSGPPYDPFQLADSLEIELVARQDLDDARLILLDGRPRIEFNAARRPARVRFSIAHEIGHFLFADYGDRVRYRDVSERRGDDWQLEILCNIAAAELIMPIGTFPIAETEDLSLPHLLDQRARFGVSTEALLRRAVKLTDRPLCLFAAARLRGSEAFRLDYLVPSRTWTPSIDAGRMLLRQLSVGGPGQHRR